MIRPIGFRLLWLFTFYFSTVSLAQAVRDVDAHVKAVVSENPPKIRLQWNTVPNTARFHIQKSTGTTNYFLNLTTNHPGTATFYDDTNVQVGQIYEYAIHNTPSSGSLVQYTGHAYVFGGIKVPFRDDQGMVAIVIDSANAAALSAKLDRLEQDLIADGWDVRIFQVSSTQTAAHVRQELSALHSQSSGRLRAALLLGKVPRVFSGRVNPDEHADHDGAYPTDMYYADLNGTWTDLQNLGGSGSFANNAGDGKFDNSEAPTRLELAVGRVDAEGMPAFTGLTSSQLLGRYLDRNHAYRTAQSLPSRRTLVKDDFGYAGGGAWARVGWRDGVAIFGTEPDDGLNFLNALESNGGYALAFGSGGGQPTLATGVAGTSEFVTRSPQATFMGLFGSYFVDWSYPDSFLRAPLFSPGTVQATLWFGRPFAHLHGLGAMHTFGDAFLKGVDVDTSVYDTGFDQGIYQGLMGDPTLRLFVTRGPSGLSAQAGPGKVDLTWAASTDSEVVGYHVYRRLKGLEAAPTRLTTQPLTAVQFSDSSAEASKQYVYRVVAAALVTSGAGTFYNHSPGPSIEVQTHAQVIVDAGVVDAGTPLFDAGPGAVDAGVDAGPKDAGVIAVDAGFQPVDAGVDGGIAPLDGGPKVVDAGPGDAGILDSGVKADAGQVDAGVQIADAGLSSAVDGGTTADAGEGSNLLPPKQGCGCSSSADFALWGLPILVSVLRARNARRKTARPSRQ